MVTVFHQFVLYWSFLRDKKQYNITPNDRPRPSLSRFWMVCSVLLSINNLYLFRTQNIPKLGGIGGRHCIIQGLPLIHIRQMRPELPQTSILMGMRKICFRGIFVVDKLSSHILITSCGCGDPLASSILAQRKNGSVRACHMPCP